MILRLVLLSFIAAGMAAQIPTIGVVDSYGLIRISPERLRKEAGLSPGDRMPPSKADLEEKLESMAGVVRALVTAHCCESGKVILYLGIEEKGAPHFDYRETPAAVAALPDYVVENYREFLRDVNDAASKGDTAEDFSRGHSLMANRYARAHQDTFVIHAELYLDRLRQVLRDSSNDEHRAVAAYLLGYAPTKRTVVDDLQYALRDPSDDVRANALRSLSAIAFLGQKDPELGIRIAPTWFVEMLNSLVWSDRYRAAEALVRLTENRDAKTIELLRERTAGPVIEMAQWKHLPHALPAFFLAGRMAGLEEKAIEQAWLHGDRGPVISRLNASLSPSDKR